jgi:hypothetical protein
MRIQFYYYISCLMTIVCWYNVLDTIFLCFARSSHDKLNPLVFRVRMTCNLGFYYGLNLLSLLVILCVVHYLHILIELLH